MFFDLKPAWPFIALVCFGLAVVSGCGGGKKPVAKSKKKSSNQTVAVAPSASEAERTPPPRPFMPPIAPANSAAAPATTLTPQHESDKPAPPRPAGTLSDLVQQGQEAEFALPQLDNGKIAAAGIRKVEGRHLTLYTDLPTTVEGVDKLPLVFDAAVPQWAKYFDVDEGKVANWKVIGCVMESKPRFQGAGLYPADLPDFPNGYQRGSQFWLFEQPSEYYRRHLLLHEGTHAFMNRWLGGAGPPWYMEGMAELLGTHQWNGEQLVMGYNPPDRALVPYWGRVKIVKDEFAANRGLTLIDIFRYDIRAHLKNDAYGWCWAATLFLDNHPATRAEFQELRKRTQDRSIEFSKKFYEALKPQWPQIAEDWQLFVINIDYGYDVARAATVRKESAPLPAGGVTVSVAADRFWQSTGVKLEAGKTYELTATGRFSVAQQPTPWWSEPNGITIEYYQGKPLGLLLAAVSEPDPKDTGITPLASPEIIGLSARFTPRKSGTLYLCLNDSPAKLADNQGAATVTIVPAADN
jgi:hypothetical protein